MTIRLRPHHLLCLLTYVGKGYSPAFTANMSVIAGRIAGGEDIEIVKGPDDICAPLLGDSEPHCHRGSVVERDLAAASDVGRLLGQPVRPGIRLGLTGARIQELRLAFAGGHVRSACAGCDWNDLCGAVASSGYEGTSL